MLAAVVRGDPKEVRAYLETGGVDINAADYGLHGNTALMVACAPTEKLRVLDYLLQCKDLQRDAVNRSGMTALHQAAWYGQELAVEMLLGAGADMTIKTPAGLTAGDMANNMGHASTLSMITREQARQMRPPVETAELLRARIKAQNCRSSEGSAAGRRLAPEPRPLLSPAELSSPAAKAAQAPAARPALKTRAPPANTVVSDQGESHVSPGTTDKYRGTLQNCGEADLFTRVPSASNRWLPAGASTARSRVEKDDAAILPKSVSGTTAVDKERERASQKEVAKKEPEGTRGDDATFFITELGIGE